MKIKGALLMCSLVLWFWAAGQSIQQKPAQAQAQANNIVVHPSIIKYPVYFDVSPPLRELGVDPPKLKGERVDVKKPPLHPHTPLKWDDIDPVIQKFMPANKVAPTIIKNFAGPSNGSFPPDANGSVGPNHYFQAYNVQYKIYDKNGNSVAGPTNYNSLFSGVTGASYNDGDPIIIYDEQAQRWLAAEFSISGSNDYMLIAVSQTSDPTGSWYRWSFDVDDMPDYMKFGVWRDGYYMATNTPNGRDVYVFNRDAMLAGNSNPAMIGFQNPNRPTTPSGFHCIMPVDNDGAFAPSGSPALFLTINDDAWGSSSTDQLWLYALTVNWSNPSASTFSRIQTINVPSFDAVFGSNWNDISQPGTTQKLDALSEMLMYSVKYRNFGNGDERIVACHSVDVGGQKAGIRWYELKKNQSSGQWELRQSGTFSPDANSRWNPSIAINKNKDIAVAYSITGSSTNVYPGLRLTGQTAASNANSTGTFDVDETVIANGVTYQSSYNRWGDYALMSVDPSDEETFWFSSSYMGISGDHSNKSTRIVAFKFPSTSNDPTNFTATAVSSSQINLSWTLNANNDPVLLAYNTSPTFGTPANGTAYSAGQSIPGGGTVLYYGTATSFSHTGLNPNTTYYYKLWSNTGSYVWSSGVTAQATTPTAPINTFPFTWDFENSSDFTTDFSPWTTVDGDGKTTYSSTDCNFTGEGTAFAWMCMNPSASSCTINGNNAHGGQRCGMAICPSDASASNDWFISPPIQLGTNSSFSFWALSPKPGTWGNDEFKVLVSTTNNNPSSFTPISGSNPVQAPPTWTQFTYDLSAYDNQTIYLAIQHTSTDKFMLWIDDLVINSTSSSCTPPSITTQPLSQTACQGSNVTFSVSASGTAPLSYQWKKNGINISGATSPTLTLNNVSSSDTGSYTCVVSNSCGNVESQAATLTINQAPSITTHPQSISACSGSNVTFTVAASGTAPLTYQWKKNGSNIAGATSYSLTLNNVSSSDVGSYSCVVTNACGTVESQAATLTLDQPPLITSQPSSQNACEGSSVTFSISASSSSTLTYQWKKNGTDIPGATSSTLTLNNVTASDTGTYSCVVTHSCGSVESQPATLTIDQTPSITTQPVSQNVCQGSTVTFTISATGTSLTYQWKKNGSNIAGATSPTLTLNNVTSSDAGTYLCVVSNSCTTLVSQPAVLTIDQVPTIITQPVSQTVCEGDAAMFMVTTYSISPTTYQWRKNGINIPGATSATLTLNNVTANDAGIYTCVITNTCGSIISDPATLSVNPATQITSQPSDLTIPEGQTATFSVVATGNNLLYQWQKNGANLTNNSHISGATSATLQIFNVTTADIGQYRCLITSSCGVVISNPAMLDVLTGIANNEKAPFLIYPNPSDGVFFVNFGDKEFNGTISVYDAQGKLVFWEKIENIKEKRISLNHLTQGQYILRIEANDKTYIEHLQIK